MASDDKETTRKRQGNDKETTFLKYNAIWRINKTQEKIENLLANHKKKNKS